MAETKAEFARKKGMHRRQFATCRYFLVGFQKHLFVFQACSNPHPQ